MSSTAAAAAAMKALCVSNVEAPSERGLVSLVSGVVGVTFKTLEGSPEFAIETPLEPFDTPLAGG